MLFSVDYDKSYLCDTVRTKDQSDRIQERVRKDKLETMNLDSFFMVFYFKKHRNAIIAGGK